MGKTEDNSDDRMVRKLLVFSLVVALAAGKFGLRTLRESGESGESKENDSGLCMDSEEVVGWCTVGTALGDKLEEAVMTCSNYEEPAGRKKGKGKGKGKGNGGKKCPTVEEVEAWFMEEHAGELCVFSELGWLDDSGNFNNETAEADLLSLPTEVSAAVSEENMDQCMEKVLGEMSEDKMVKKCVEGGKYSEEELEQLMDFAEGTAAIKCFLYLFQDAS